MARFAPTQSDLFAPPRETAERAPQVDPICELNIMLDSLRRAGRMPWPDAAGAAAEERRALGLAALSGEEGCRLAAAILQETERLLSMSEAG